MYADKYVHHTDEIPTEPHWVIITNSSVTIPGDERSRTNPGHGYPERTERYITYEIYLTEEKWKQAIREQENPSYGIKQPYIAMYVQPAQIIRNVEVEIK